MKAADQKNQADTLAYYLIKRPISEPMIYSLYADALRATGTSMQEQKLLQFTFAHPSTLPFLDAGLALVRPTSELRRRIYIMFSVLESSPTYAEFLLPKKHGVGDTIGAFMAGVRAVVRALIGVILIKAARL